MINAGFSIAPLFGDVFATTFSAVNTTTGDPVKKIIWDFGTSELLYNNDTPKYVYKTPGIYTVQLTAIDYSNFLSTASTTISVDFAYRDYIQFTQVPENFPDPGKLPEQPFKIKVVSTNTTSPIQVDLFASNSNSTPYQFVPNKWSFLNPIWKFLDTNLSAVTTITIPSTPIYKNNVIVALSGTASFYFVDSTSTGDPTKNDPILITATLQTSAHINYNDSYTNIYPSYANTNTVQAGVLWLVNDLYPNTLKVTGNYITPINKKQWQDVKIPVLVTCHSNKSLVLPGASNQLSEVLFTYPKNNRAGTRYPLLLSLNKLTPNQYSIDDELPLYFKATNNNSRTGGYIFTTITCNSTANNVTITARTTAFNDLENFDSDKFPYPYGYVFSEAVWISNPVRNTLNKIKLVPFPENSKSITPLKENKVLIDGTIKEINVPFSAQQNTINYELSGFSGIYGISVDPRFNDIVACDAELDRLYRISNSGKILKTFELSSLGDFNRTKKMFDNWSWEAVSPMASSSRYAFYGPTIIHPNPANYIFSVGGVIQTNDSLQIYTTPRVIRLTRPLHIDEKLFTQNAPLSSYVFTYPPDKTRVDAIQIFSPTLPQEYISTLYTWTTTTPTPVLEWTLSANPLFDPSGKNLSYKNLNSNTCKYIVSVGGLLQRPTSYTINTSNNKIVFSEQIPPNKRINIIYAPELPATQSWSRTYTTSTNTFSFINVLNYVDDPLSNFLVSVGGLLQNPDSFLFDYQNKQLVFAEDVKPGVEITVIQYSLLDTAYNPAAYTPTYLSLDKNYNIWVSLFNSVSVLKFDKDFNFLHASVPNNIEWLKRAWTVLPKNRGYESAQFEDVSRMIQPTTEDTFSQDSYTNEFFLKPPVAETDKENNCWVTYAHPLCSLIVKYSPSGSVLTQIPLKPYTMPISLAVTPKNNIWVANFHGSSYTYTALSGSLQLYNSTTSALLTTITGISRPGHMALDRDGNVWFSHSTRRLGFLNTRSGLLTSWTLDLTGGFQPYNPSIINSETFDFYENHDDDDIGGLAVDTYNRVWVIDNYDNNVWVLTASPYFPDKEIRKFQIRPNTFVGYYPDINTGATIVQDDKRYKYRSAQATGDWTGNRWYQKYATPQLLSAVSLTGRTATGFNVEPFINKYQLKLQNESFNMGEYFHSLALPENLYNNNKLFKDIIPGFVGTGIPSNSEDLGQTLYEKIANFTNNHGDIDTCNVKQLLSYAEQTAVPAADYGTEMPAEVQRMLNIASIPRSKLWGIKNVVPNIAKSIGSIYNTLTDQVTAGTKIILKNKFDSNISLVQVPLLENRGIYPLKDIQLYGFATPVIDMYLFYRFTPQYDTEFIENLIDWSSEYTTLNPELSTNEDWYGDEQVLEEAFRYILTKNLFLK